MNCVKLLFPIFHGFTNVSERTARLARKDFFLCVVAPPSLVKPSSMNHFPFTISYSGLMLNRKGESLDLQEGRLTEKAIEVDAQGMSSKFGVEAST